MFYNGTCRWIVGALDSAWRAVYEYLLASGKPPTTINKFFKLWGSNVEWTCSSSKLADGILSGSDSDANTLLRVHMGYTYVGEMAGEVK